MSIYSKAIGSIKGISKSGWKTAKQVGAAGRRMSGDSQVAGVIRRSTMAEAMRQGGKQALRGAGIGAAAGAFHGAIDEDETVMRGAFKGATVGAAAAGIYGGAIGARAGYATGLGEASDLRRSTLKTARARRKTQGVAGRRYGVGAAPSARTSPRASRAGIGTVHLTDEYMSSWFQN